MPQPGEESGQESGTETEIDLNNPAVKAALAQASLQAVAEARKDWEGEVAGLKTNRDEVLEEKRKYQELGSLSELSEMRKKFEDLENEKAASSAGGDPAKFAALVEEKAQAKYLAKETELSEAMKAKSDRVSELEAEVEASNKLAHRRFVEAQITRAALPKDQKIVHDGAWEHLVATLEPLVEAENVAGIGEVARIKTNGALVPGEGPEGYMGVREMVSLARQGKGPAPGIAFCFVDAGSGSKPGTTDTQKAGGGSFGSNWFKLSDEQKLQYRKENGPEKTKDFIGKSSEANLKAS